MKRIKRFICTLIGHRFDVLGLTGKYVWCSRCGQREHWAMNSKYDHLRGLPPIE